MNFDAPVVSIVLLLQRIPTNCYIQQLSYDWSMSGGWHTLSRVVCLSSGKTSAVCIDCAAPSLSSCQKTAYRSRRADLFPIFRNISLCVVFWAALLEPRVPSAPYSAVPVFLISFSVFVPPSSDFVFPPTAASFSFSSAAIC